MDENGMAWWILSMKMPRKMTSLMNLMGFFFGMIHADTCRNDAFRSKSYKEFMLCIIYLNVVRCDSQTPLHSDTQVRIGFPIACTRATAAQAVPLCDRTERAFEGVMFDETHLRYDVLHEARTRTFSVRSRY